jgi:hypothetical protein
VVLVGLLVAEGVTIVQMRDLRSAHMFIGLVLIPPVLLKLGSTGYRMISYYAGSRAYRLAAPPLLPLRLMAPVLVASTIAVFASGVMLLVAGHKSNAVLTIHKLSFIVFGVVLAVHFLAYVPRVVRSMRSDWGTARRHAVAGAGARAMLVAAAVGGGGSCVSAATDDPRLRRLTTQQTRGEDTSSSHIGRQGFEELGLLKLDSAERERRDQHRHGHKLWIRHALPTARPRRREQHCGRCPQARSARLRTAPPPGQQTSFRRRADQFPVRARPRLRPAASSQACITTKKLDATAPGSARSRVPEGLDRGSPTWVHVVTTRGYAWTSMRMRVVLLPMRPMSTRLGPAVGSRRFICGRGP